MLRPVLVSGPAVLPVTVEEAKLALRIDGSDIDSEIESAIKAAVAHYEGWNGLLGICLVEQTWRIDFGRFERCMFLPLRPVQSITSIKWRQSNGQISTVPSAEYAYRTEAGGSSVIIFRDSYSFPADLHELAPVSVEYVIGWPVVEGKATTPEDLKAAIKLRAQLFLDEAALANSEHLERVEKALISKHQSFA